MCVEAYFQDGNITEYWEENKGFLAILSHEEGNLESLSVLILVFPVRPGPHVLPHIRVSDEGYPMICGEMDIVV
jgi:hypothetical protein